MCHRENQTEKIPKHLLCILISVWNWKITSIPFHPQEKILHALKASRAQQISNVKEHNTQHKWTYASAFLYSLTLITTIGKWWNLIFFFHGRSDICGGAICWVALWKFINQKTAFRLGSLTFTRKMNMGNEVNYAAFSVYSIFCSSELLLQSMSV